MRHICILALALALFTTVYSYEQGFFVTQSDYFNGNYEYVGYVSSIGTPNPYRSIKGNTPKQFDECIEKLIGQAKNLHANWILSLKWNLRLWS